MCPELLPADQDGDVRQDVSAAQPVQIEQNVTGMARELYAAVCRASHFVKLCKAGKESIQIYNGYFFCKTRGQSPVSKHLRGPTSCLIIH